MVVLHFIVVGLLLVILQTTLFMPNPVWMPAPDLYFVLVAYLAIRLDLMRGLIILFPLTCMLDVVSGTILGTFALLCFSGYFLLRQLVAKLPVNDTLYQIPLIGVSFLVVSWAVAMFLELLRPGQLVAWSWWKMGVRVLLVAACTYPLFFLFDVIQKYSQHSFLPLKKLRLRSDNRRRRQA